MRYCIAFLSGVILFFSFRYFPFSISAAALLISGFLVRKRKYFGTAVMLICGTAYAFLRYAPDTDMPYIKDNVFVNGTFRSYPSRNAAGTFEQTFLTKTAVNAATGERVNQLAGKEIVVFAGSAFDPGTECDLRIALLRNGNRLNPGETTSTRMYAKLLETFRIGGSQASLRTGIEKCRYRIDRYLGENLGPESAAFISSITVGRKKGMSDGLREAFSTVGLAHILSISGTHFGLFYIFLFGLFRALLGILPYRFFQRVTIYATPSQVAALMSLPFMLVYLGLSGASVPAVRAFIMMTLFLLGLIIGRRGYWLNSVLFAACIIVAWDPASMLSPSFQLSFLAVLSIGFVVNIGEREKDEGGRVMRYFRNASRASLSASIGTAPLVAYYFHYLSLISPVANLLLSPLIGFILIPVSVVSCVLLLITGHFVSGPLVSWLSEVGISSVRTLSGIPFASISVPSFPPVLLFFLYGGMFVYLLSSGRIRTECGQLDPAQTPQFVDPSEDLLTGKSEDTPTVAASFRSRNTRYLLFTPLIPLEVYCLLQSFGRNHLSVTFLDVGQGDSEVVEFPDGKTMVIDTGRTGRETAAFLKYRGRRRVDVLVLSHTHPDHTGGLQRIVEKFMVGEVWDNGRMILPGTLRTRSLNRGDVAEGNGYRIHALHPYPEFYTMERSEYLSENNDSLVLKIEGDGLSFLLTGDIDEEAEREMVPLGRWIKSCILKVPHHGGRTSAYGPFLVEVSPEIAVISAGRDNPFGHPHRETLDRLEGIRVLRTDVDGAVKIMGSGEGPVVKTYNDFRLKEAWSFGEELKNVHWLFGTW